MSFDLAVWLCPIPITSDDAGIIYVALCKEYIIESLVKPSDSVARFISELTARYPQPDDLSGDEFDTCPWSCAFDFSECYCIMNIGWPFVDDIVPYVIELALRHNLVCYDPQNEFVHLPSQLRNN
jgi:hypothetical protein